MMAQGGAWELLNSLYSCDDKGSKIRNTLRTIQLPFINRIQSTSTIELNLIIFLDNLDGNKFCLLRIQYTS